MALYVEFLYRVCNYMYYSILEDSSPNSIPVVGVGTKIMYWKYMDCVGIGEVFFSFFQSFV